MHSPLDTPLLAAARPLDRPAVLSSHGEPDWTWREIHDAALTLAAQLDDASSICNLCSSRVGFLVTWLAALRRGCLQLLPPSGGRTDLAAILAAQTQPLVVFDEAVPPQGTENTRRLKYVPVRSSGHARSDLSWSPNWEASCVHLYTSGSSGAPVAQIKTLGQLVRGAQLLGQSLNTIHGLAAQHAFICSVPPQHMFGLETSVMLPLVHGHAVFEGRPLLPADVQSAFENLKQNSWWVATPLHLRALVQSGQALSQCHAILTSTMPLSPALAQQTETLLRAPVLEIYGSSETGALALRRTAHSSHWQPLPGIEFSATEQGTRFSGAHFPSPQILADQIETVAPGNAFNLLGRQGDLIKIAGRRASLAQLNSVLQELPGLVDGTLYLPHDDLPIENTAAPENASPPKRLVLIHTGAPLPRAATETWLRQRIDPVFVPRTFICVERLPRTDTGKLPRAALDALYAQFRAQQRAQKKRVARRTFEFEIQIPTQHPSLPGHFPSQPLVPGVVLLDALLNALQQATRQRVNALPQVKFLALLRPQQVARAWCEIENKVENGVENTRATFRITTVSEDKEPITLAQGQLTLNPSLAQEAPR